MGMMIYLPRRQAAGFVVLGYRHGEPFILCVDLCEYRRHLLSVCVPSLLHWLRAEGLVAFNSPPVSSF